MWRPAILVLSLLASFLAGPGRAQEAPGFDDPIALTGHGSLFDAEGREIEVTPDFLRRTLETYAAQLLDRADPALRAEFRDLQGRAVEALAGAEARQRDELLAQASLVRWLEARQPRDRRVSTNVGIVLYLIESLGVEGLEEAPPAPALTEFLASLAPPDDGVVAFSTLNAGAAYIAECAANGVPIPPDWGSPQWVATGSLSDAQEFISQGAEARPFRFASTSPPGTCIALPRVQGDVIGLLGIICLGTQTGKACFWDNQQNDQGFLIDVGEAVPLSDFAGGAELEGGSGGTCTACHAGENPFIIHPGTALGMPALGPVDLMANVWHDPLVHPSWPQNPGPSAVVDAIPGAGQCTGCHSQAGGAGRFPQMSLGIPGYCGTIFPEAVARTMPPGAPGSALATAHVQAMLALCQNVPAPLLRLEAEVLDFGEVELGFSFAKALVIHNDGDAALTVSVELATPADADLPQWPEVTLSPSVTLQPGDPPLVLRQVYAPQALGTHGIGLRVVSNDATAPSTTVSMTGEGVTPRPIDSVLVLDRSGSMSDLAGDRTKIEAMRDAVMLYTDLLREDVGGSGTGDRLGFVRYNATSDVYMPLTEIGPGVQDAIGAGELGDAALADPGALRPDGTTGIGGAMLDAAAEIGALDADRGQVMVVLTDGRENEAPFISDAIADLQANAPFVQTYSVGLGFDIEPTKLQAITNMGTEGYHQVVSTLQDQSLFDLETFYFKIFASAAEMDLVTDPTHVVDLSSAEPVVVDRARVISSDRNAVFLVLDDPSMRALYELEFLAPDGTVLTAGSTVGGIAIHEQSRNTYRIFRIVFPDPSQAQTYVGDWTLRLVPNGRWTPAVGRRLAAGSRITYGGAFHPIEGQVPIGFAGAVASDYRFAGSVTASTFLPGATLRLDAALTDRQWPAPDGEVTVTITRPDGVVHTVVLEDDGLHGDGEGGDAAWANAYSQTAVPGVYRILFRAVGRNERGELAPRLLERFVTLGEPEPDPEDPRGDPGGDPGGDPSRCTGCEGHAAAYLIGSYDLRQGGRSAVHVMNPTARPLDVVVSLFDSRGQPQRCTRGRLESNALQEILIDRLDPPDRLGVIKVVAFRPDTQTPTIGIVGNQLRVTEGAAVETGLHPISRDILEEDLSRILEACR